jgi:hypothetical protein
MGPCVRGDDGEYVLSYCKFPRVPRTSRPGCAPVAVPPRCVTTPETMVAS